MADPQPSPMIVNAGRLYKAIAPQQLQGYILQGFILSMYDRHSNTAYMYSCSGDPTNLSEILKPIKNDFPDTSKVRIRVNGNTIPKDLAARVANILSGCSVGIVYIADTMDLKIDINPATGEYTYKTGRVQPLVGATELHPVEKNRERILN